MFYVVGSIHTRQKGAVMPFIDAKISLNISQEKKDSLKSRFGKAVSVMHKTEQYLMVGIQDNYTLYMGGEQLEKCAFISVSIYGQASSNEYTQMTKEICSILEEEIGIPGTNVYVTYQGLNDWGWNHMNF